MSDVIGHYAEAVLLEEKRMGAYTCPCLQYMAVAQIKGLFLQGEEIAWRPKVVSHEMLFFEAIISFVRIGGSGIPSPVVKKGFSQRGIP